ncbi:GTPase-activating protein GYP1 isoform X2 [Dendrobium catenatum]|uniref:GTPase-activating protein GYP1 isoform X2 n=1 Tax=Dendrobium catenatum TaxID=906689 RepID=UPI0010A0B13F|nr:GTPase-activating protein GYP1 isoform X2 [Dendrobium catenatum]
MTNSGDEERSREAGGGGSSSEGGDSPSPNLEWRFNQTLRNVQGLLKGRSFPGKVLVTRKSETMNESISPRPPEHERSYEENYFRKGEHEPHSFEKESLGSGSSRSGSSPSIARVPSVNNEVASPDTQRSSFGARATDSARVTKFTKEMSKPAVILEKLRELAWSGVPPYMRPQVWRLLLGYAPPNSDRRQGVLSRKRLEYLDSVAQFYDIPDTERSDDEITMLRQIAVDCPRTVPDVTFFQNEQVQKSLERILYTWAIRHPASGYVQGINDLVTPFLIDHYTFAQPGIQRLVFKLKELVRRIDEPVSRHMEEQGLEFLQFAFRWFNCLLIREIPFHLVTRLWDTYLAEGDSLPEFLVYISASFLLTWSDKLQKLEFQEMVMFLQHLPTQIWTHHELEMVLSRAFMWHAMFNSSPSHLAN